MSLFTYVNHASFKLEVDHIHLIIDPWLEGSVFDKGWDLLVPTPKPFFNFSQITHIWFSHEHPDHFAPWCLKNIDEELRKNITILFQYTIDKRVINFCKKLSFKIIELENGKEYTLSENLKITCGKMGDTAIDSWLLMHVFGKKILNLNDCVVDDFKTARLIHNKTGDVDILCTQFSYANWVGNPEEKERRQKFRREKLLRIKLQDDIFNPNFIMPFASFVYFSHEENKYLNEDINTIEEVVSFISKNTDAKPVVFYPEETWDLESNHVNDYSLKKYCEAYQALENKEFTKPLKNEDINLIYLSELYVKKIKENNNKFLLYLYSKVCGNLNIKLFYSKTGYRFNLWSGLSEYRDINRVDIEMSDESLSTIFKFEWGIGSVQVNGRYRAYNGGEAKLSKIFMLGLLNSTDHYLEFKSVVKGLLRRYISILPKIAVRVLSKLNINTDIEFDVDYSYYKSWNRYLLKKN